MKVMIAAGRAGLSSLALNGKASRRAPGQGRPGRGLGNGQGRAMDGSAAGACA